VAGIAVAVAVAVGAANTCPLPTIILYPRILAFNVPTTVNGLRGLSY
jgi:hypothetical protein